MHIILSILFLSVCYSFVINVPGDYSTIQEGIETSENGDTVLVAAGIYVENIDFYGKNIAVIGEDMETTIIDGGASGSVVFYSNCDATLTGFTIQNGNSPDFGGGIRSYEDSGHLNLTHCNIKNNFSEQEGGGIWVWGNNASLTIDDCEIKNNESQNGGGIFCNFGASIDISNSNIGVNVANEGGGGICNWGSTLNLYNCVVANNSAYHGGGMWITEISGYLNATNCQIYNNNAIWCGGCGIIENAQANFTNCKIYENNAGDDNLQEGASGGIGTWKANITLTGCEIYNNFGYWFGGGVGIEHSVATITNCNIHHNSTAGNGGGISLFTSNPILIDVTISNNIAQWNGGGINSNSSNMNLSNVKIIQNVAVDNDGGGIICHNSNPILSDVIISHNTSYDIGGGVRFTGSSIPNFSSTNRCSIFSNNTTNRGSGADIYSFDSNKIAVIVDTFTVMDPTEYHASPLDKFTFDIKNSIIPPTAQKNADLYVSPMMGDNTNDGLTQETPLKTIQYATSIILADNTHPHTIYLADGIYSPSKNGEYFPVDVINYVSLMGESEDGVILDAEGVSNVMRCSNVTHSTISNLTLKNGSSFWGSGGITCFSSSPSLENVTITENSTYYSGGGIACFDNSNPSLENVTITGNSAELNGGGIACIDNSNPSLENVTITGNSAELNGGGVWCSNNSNPILRNCILWNDSPQEMYFNKEYDPNSIKISYSDIQGGENSIVTNDNGTVHWLAGNINMNPYFIDPENDNYHLMYFSPCVDMGDPESDLDMDGTSADMGAYYYDQNIPNHLLNGAWITVPEEVPSVYIIFDGEGLITELGGYFMPDTAGWYSVDSDGGSISGSIGGSENNFPFTGQILNETMADLNIVFENKLAGQMIKVMDEGACRGNWFGTFSDDETNINHEVNMEIDESGLIVSGMASVFDDESVSGRFFYEDPYLVGHLSFGEANHEVGGIMWQSQIGIEGGSLLGNTMEGSYGADGENINGGTFSLIRETVLGCTNPEACNYNPAANVDDGSCEYPPEGTCDCAGSVLDDCGVCGGANATCTGCTNSSALNHDSDATIDDGNCIISSGVYDTLLIDTWLLDVCLVWDDFTDDGVGIGDPDTIVHDFNYPINYMDGGIATVGFITSGSNQSDSIEYIDINWWIQADTLFQYSLSSEVKLAQHLYSFSEDNNELILKKLHVADFGCEEIHYYRETPLSLYNGSIPLKYSIHSIYPNPFNPVTNITYGLSEYTSVQIIIYDIMGRHVQSLINESQSAGYHRVDWNADAHPSGVYFVKIVAGDYVNTQKLMLVK